MQSSSPSGKKDGSVSDPSTDSMDKHNGEGSAPSSPQKNERLGHKVLRVVGVRRRDKERYEADIHTDDSWFGVIVNRVRARWRQYLGKAVDGDEIQQLGTIQVHIRGGAKNLEHGSKVKDNTVTMSKYTWWSFVPLATSLQFRRFSNAFYLLIIIVNSIGFFSPTLFAVSYVPWGTLGVLIVVIAVTLLFEGRDDLERHRADYKINHKLTRIVEKGTGETVEKTWYKLLPGDVVRINKGETIPADILIIRTAANNGKCYIDTRDIDGETNLKIRQIPKDLRLRGCDGASVEGTIFCEEPSALLQFSGTLVSSEQALEDVSLDFDSMILRGSVLRNTDWIEGIVVYAGEDSKLARSGSETSNKFSRVDSLLNRIMGYSFLAWFVLVIIATVCLLVGTPNTANFWYFGNENVISAFIFPPVIAWFLTFSGTFASIIPINLYVCLEVVNFFLSFFINTDKNMYYESEDVYARCRTGSLVGEIGQVTHIFSDKTGTLTNNELRLVSFTVGSEWYGWKPPALDNAPDTEQSNMNVTPPSVKASELFNDVVTLRSKNQDTAEAKRLDLFMSILALCHTIVIDHDKDGNLQYNAEGPDEEALVSCMDQLGTKLVSTDEDTYVLRGCGGTDEDEESFEVVGVNKFTSARKRMSVVLRSKKTKEGMLVVKGADNVMIQSCKPLEDGPKKDVGLALDRMSNHGLRTLVVGYKKLSEKEIYEWLCAKADADKTVGSDRSEALARAAATVEVDFEVVGVTGIEDRLQENVATTIQTIRDAGIRFWVLTGDKVETAINIGLSAGIIESSMSRVLLEGGDSVHDSLKESVERLRKIRSGLAHKDKVSSDVCQSAATEPIEEELDSEEHDGVLADSLCLIVTGAALVELLKDENGTVETQNLLLELSSFCSVVMACRVSPQQKALLVRMVEKRKGLKKRKRPCTLAIGDGANDVAMIQEARVGVGISGNEGLQAANSSDFSIGRFYFLKDLLFVHGRWNYIRLALMVKYVCCTWIMEVLVVFPYLFYSLVSGQSIFVNSYYLTFFCWTTQMIVTAHACLQRDINREVALSYPRCYDCGRNNIYLDGFAIGKMLFRACAFAFFMFIVFLTFNETVSLDEIGIVTYFALFVALLARQCEFAMDISILSLAFIVFVIVVFFVTTWAADGICPQGYCLAKLGVSPFLVFAPGVSLNVWVSGLLLTFLFVGFDHIVFGCRKLWFPNQLRIARELSRFKRSMSITKFEDDKPLLQRGDVIPMTSNQSIGSKSESSIHIAEHADVVSSLEGSFRSLRQFNSFLS